MIAQTSITIARAPEDVYAFLADPRNDTLWCVRVRAVESLGAGEYRVMHKPPRLQPRPYALQMRLLAADPPRRLRWEETDRDGTLLVDYDLSGLHARVRFLARLTIPRHVAEQARALKEHLERG